MLLLNIASLQLCEFPNDATPPYATFSAKPEHGDVVYEDLCNLQMARQRPGFQALQRACSECQSRGLQWLWNDAICIDRSTALSQTLNSLAEVYRKGRVCIVYLHDLLDIAVSAFDVGRGLSKCSWFKNVWMLPHLIFSMVLHFYDGQWNHVGGKMDLIPALSRLTSIHHSVLKDPDTLKNFSSSAKMSWAAGLSADRVEDAAYSLLGIFNVTIPIQYGEGMGSFVRLQEEILRNTTDYSLLAWQPRTNQAYRGLLAHSPLEYSHFKDTWKESPTFQGDLMVQSDGIHLNAVLGGRGNDLLLPLHASDGSRIWIVLSLWDGLFVRNCMDIVLEDTEITEVSNIATRNIVVRLDVSPDLSSSISMHRAACLSHQHVKASCDASAARAITSLSRSTSNLCNRRGSGIHAGSEPKTGEPSLISRAERSAYMLQRERGRIGIVEVVEANSRIAWSADVSNSEVAHLLPNEDQDDRWPFGFLDEISSRFQANEGSLSDSTSQSRSHAGETTNAASPRYSPNRRSEQSQPGSPSTMDPDHPFATVIGDLKGILVDRFLSTCNTRPGKRALLSWSQTSRKRPKLDWSEPYKEVELASDSEDTDTVVVHHAGERTSTLVCPFYLMDKKRHEECLTRHSLSTIDELKEHLWASHRRPNYCPICKTTFETLSARDHHIRGRSCEHRDSPTFDGLTDGQIQRLARQGSCLSSRQDQWYELWNVVSPLGERPASPYFSNKQEFQVLALRRYWEAHGHNIISEFLGERGLQGWDIPDEERNLAILFKVVLYGATDEVYQRFSRDGR